MARVFAELTRCSALSSPKRETARGSDDPMAGLDHLTGVTAGKLLALTGSTGTGMERVLRREVHALAHGRDLGLGPGGVSTLSVSKEDEGSSQPARLTNPNLFIYGSRLDTRWHHTVELLRTMPAHARRPWPPSAAAGHTPRSGPTRPDAAAPSPVAP